MNRNIAIVEDEVEEAEILRSYFTRYSQEYSTTFTVTHFESAEAFLNRYRPMYDLVLMDICLPKTSGMDAAMALRTLDQSVPLIFVTNMAQFAVKGYEVDAFDFIVKPVSYANFALKIHRLLGRLNSRRDGEVLVTLSDHIIRLSASQIKYIEISGHRVIYHTTNGEVTAYGNLKAIEASLDAFTFTRCNSCYLVNLNYVQAIQACTVLVDGEPLQISRPRRRAFIQALNDYLGGGIS